MNELRDQLWDFVYGLLDEADAARLREQITSDRHVAREYARVKLQSELVAQAARANQVDRDLPTLGERRTAAALERAWSPARRIVFTGSLALSLGLLLFAGSVYWSDQASLRGPNVALRLEEFQAKQPRLLVVGPDELQRNADNTYEVSLETLRGEALVAPIEASLEDSAGNRLWYESAPTNADGKRLVQLPADKLQGEEALLLKIRVDGKSAADGADKASGAELNTWLSVSDQPEDNLVVMNHVSNGEQFYYREAELHSRRYAVPSKAVDELSNAFSENETKNETKKSSSKGRGEPNVDLAQDADRVRWGVDPSQQEWFLNKYYLAPATDDVKQRKDEKEDSAKHARDSRIKPSRTPSPQKSVELQTEPQAAPSAPAPLTDPQAVPPSLPPGSDAPVPLESAPESPAQPGTTTAGSGLGKKQLSAPAPAVVNAPAVKSLPKLEQAEQPAAEEEQLSQRSKSLERGTQVLVESITAGDTVVASRLVDGTATEAMLQQRVDEARNKGLIPPGFSGPVKIRLYDPAVAPPQKLAETSFDVGPAVEPLNCTIWFDRMEYRAGDIAQAEVRVSGADGQGTPAVLNVQVDEVPLHESDAEGQPRPAFHLYTSAETPRLPLVFDNAAEQTQQVNESLSGWLAERQESRRHSGLWLLGGSGLGLGLLLVAGCLKGLPQARYWLPVAVLLSCSATLGASWLQALPAAPMQIAAADPLTTHGVQSTPPAQELTIAPSSHDQLAEGRVMERLSRNDFAESPLAMDDQFLSFMAETDESGPATKGQALRAMDDWEKLSQRGLISGSLAGGKKEPAAADFARFRAGKDSLFGAATTELATKEFFDSPLGRPGASSATGVVPTGGDPSGSRTLYWHPRLTADDDGICRVQFPVPHSRLALRLVVLAHSGERVGSATRLIPTVVEISDH